MYILQFQIATLRLILKYSLQQGRSRATGTGCSFFLFEDYGFTFENFVELHITM